MPAASADPQAPIITPATCAANRLHVTFWCEPCRRGVQPLNWDQPHWRRRWDEPLASIWRRGLIKCGKCGEACTSFDVARQSAYGGKFEVLLSMKVVKVEGVIDAKGQVRPRR